MTNHITTKLTNPNQDQRHTIPSSDYDSSLDSEDDYRLGSRYISDQQQSSKDHPHPDDHAKQIHTNK